MPRGHLERQLSDTRALRCGGHRRVGRSETARESGFDHPRLWTRQHRDPARDRVGRVHRDTITAAVTLLQKRQDKVARQALRDKAFWRPVAFQSGCRQNDERHSRRTEATSLSARREPYWGETGGRGGG